MLGWAKLHIKGWIKVNSWSWFSLGSCTLSDASTEDQGTLQYRIPCSKNRDSVELFSPVSVSIMGLFYLLGKRFLLTPPPHALWYPIWEAPSTLRSGISGGTGSSWRKGRPYNFISKPYILKVDTCLYVMKDAWWLTCLCSHVVHEVPFCHMQIVRGSVCNVQLAKLYGNFFAVCRFQILIWWFAD